MTDQQNNEQLVELVADIVSAYVSNNPVQAGDLPGLITSVHGSVASLASGSSPAAEPQEPAVPIKRSVKNNAITCLECGKKFKSLKRHMGTVHEMTPEEYRAKWGLPPSYPMVAPASAAARSEMAKSLGLGRKPAAKRGRKR